MPDKKQQLLESIRKLRRLGIPDKEILAHLRKAHIPEADARALLAESGDRAGLRESEDEDAGEDAGSDWRDELDLGAEDEDAEEGAPQELEAEDDGAEYGEGLEGEPGEGEGEADEEEAEGEAVDGDEAGDAGKEEEGGEPGEEAGEAEPDEEAEEYFPRARGPEPPIKHLSRAHVEAIVDERVGTAFLKEKTKLEVLLESRTDLMKAKLTSELERQKQAIENELAASAKALQELNEVVQKNMQKIDAQRKLNDDLAKELQDKVVDLMAQQKKVAESTTKEIEASDARLKEYLADANAQLRELEDRMKETSEKQSTLLDSLVQDAETKLGKQLNRQLDEAVSKLEARAKQFDPAKADKLLDQTEKELHALQRFKAGLEKTVSRDALDKVEARLRAHDKAAMEREAERKQLVKLLKENVSAFEDAKRDFEREWKKKEAKLDKLLRKR